MSVLLNFCHFRLLRRWLPLLLVCVLPGLAAADDSWVGKTILLKKNDVRLAQTDKDGREVDGPTLYKLSYVVVAVQDKRVKVRHNSAEGWIDRADAVLQEDAVDFFTQRIAANPKDATAYVRRAQARCLSNEVDKSLEDVEQAIRLDPKEPGAFLLRGFLLYFKQPDKALEDYSEAIRLDPKCALAFNNRAMIWSSKKEYDKAIKDLTEAFRIDPTLTDVLTSRGDVWYAKGDFDKAISDYDEAIRRDPKDFYAYYRRGATRFDLREYDKALKNYDDMIRLFPQEPLGFTFRGTVWHAKKDFDKAIKDYDEAIRLDAKSVSAFCYRARAFAAKKDYDKAVADFEQALKLGPTSVFVLREYALFRAACPEAKYRDGTKALKMAKQALEKAGKGAGWEYEAALAAAYAETEDFDQAVAEQKKALADPSLDKQDRERLEKRLALYQNKKPYRLED
jgi:tetratricopeptide (TPR) repeat protein